MPTNAKISIKELATILNVCTKTASKEYKVIIDCVSRPRNYVTQGDLQKYGL